MIYSTQAVLTRVHMPNQLIDISWHFISRYHTMFTRIPGGDSQGTQMAGALVMLFTAVMYGLWLRSLTDSNLQAFRIHGLM